MDNSSHDAETGSTEPNQKEGDVGLDNVEVASGVIDESQERQGEEEEAGEQLEPEDVFESKKSERLLLRAEAPSTTSQRIVRHSAILGVLMFTSLWGFLTREGLIALNTYSGMSIDPTIWPQAFGCLVMGWAIGNKEALETWYPPAFIAITTGYCGSVTTFSTWILQVFQAYSNQNHYDRHGLHNVMDALTQTAATLGMSMISLYAGKELATVLPIKPVLYYFESRTAQRKLNKEAQLYGNGNKNPKTDSKPQLPYAIAPDIFCILLGIAFWAASAILCGTYPPFRRITYALVFSPPGAILRWYLSPLNSHRRSKERKPYWPLGTLAANLIATAVLAAVFVGQNVGRPDGLGSLRGAHSIDGCNVLYGIDEGFCGCLSTISTFVVELSNLRPGRRAFGYALGSYVLGIIICVLIIGAPWWSLGMEGSCNTLGLSS